MKPDPYDEKQARTHIKKFKEILYSPVVLVNQTEIGSAPKSSAEAKQGGQGEKKPPAGPMPPGPPGAPGSEANEEFMKEYE